MGESKKAIDLQGPRENLPQLDGETVQLSPARRLG